MVNPPDRYPLASLARWLAPATAVIAALLGVLTVLGVLSGVQAGQLSELWLALVAALVPAIGASAGVAAHARLGRRHVTPTADPRDEDGTRLVRIDSPRLRAADEPTSPIRYAPSRRERHGAARHSLPEDPS